MRGPTSPARPCIQPLLLSGVLLILVRLTGLISFFVSRDPNGNAIAASPLNALIVAVPYHGAFVLATVAALLAIWKLAGRARRAVTITGTVICLAAITLGQIDFGMQWFIGQRFSPMIFETYLGGDLFSSDLYAPVLFHPWYFVSALTLILGPWIVLAWNFRHCRRGVPSREAGWTFIAVLAVVAGLCRIPVSMAYGHQRDVLQPPESLFVHHWIFTNDVPPPENEAAAVAQLRSSLDPHGTSRWLSPHLPLVRTAPVARNRYLQGKAADPAPDIILFAVESLRGAEVGYVPGNYAPGESTPTPHLDELAKRSVVFSHYLSSGNPSPRGFFGINGGVWDHRGSFIIARATDSEFDALPARLRRAGYFTLGLWGANPSFDNQLFWANKWYDRIRYAAPVGRFVIMKPLADDVLVDQLIDEIGAHDRAKPSQPLFAYVATATTHEPYTLQGETHAPAALVKSIAEETDVRRRYRLVLAHLDAQIGRALEFLKTRKSLRPLVVIVVGDHSDIAGEIVPPELRGLPHNGVVWTAALVSGPESLVGPPRIETFPSSHPDLTPTLLDFAGDRGPTISMGANLFADLPLEERTAIAISGYGYRLDRGGWTLFVRRETPEVMLSMPAFAPNEQVRLGLTGSPFTTADARRLWENMNTWSYFIEHNRVWRDAVLKSDFTSAPVR